MAEFAILSVLLTGTLWILKYLPHVLAEFWKYREGFLSGAFLVFMALAGGFAIVWQSEARLVQIHPSVCAQLLWMSS
jgi:hypothetical protein